MQIQRPPYVTYTLKTLPDIEDTQVIFFSGEDVLSILAQHQIDIEKKQ